MTRPRSSAALAFAAAALVASAPALAKPAAREPTGTALAQVCEERDGWSDAAPPAPVFANVWFVGTCGISAILITGDKGHVLIDGGPRDAAPLVLANIWRLGIDPKQVRWILSSHEHYDHAGAIRALQRATGAKVAALATEKASLEVGRMSTQDPQNDGKGTFDSVRVDKVVQDGESLVLGRLVLTAHATPTHSPGSTSWTWQACTAAFNCRMVAYADSATVISTDAYRFTDHPERIAAARAGLETIAALPCDVLITPHPSASNLFARLAGKAPLVDPGACQTYAAAARTRLADRLRGEAAGSAK